MDTEKFILIEKLKDLRKKERSSKVYNLDLHKKIVKTIYELKKISPVYSKDEADIYKNKNYIYF